MAHIAVEILDARREIHQEGEVARVGALRKRDGLEKHLQALEHALEPGVFQRWRAGLRAVFDMHRLVVVGVLGVMREQVQHVRDRVLGHEPQKGPHPRVVRLVVSTGLAVAELPRDALLVVERA